MIDQRLRVKEHVHASLSLCYLTPLAIDVTHFGHGRCLRMVLVNQRRVQWYVRADAWHCAIYFIASHG